VPLIAGLGGMLFVASAFSADGNDLRPATTDLQTLVEARAGEVSTLRADIRALQAEIDQMAAGISGSSALRDVHRAVARLRAPAGLTPVSGPGMVVTLDDSPEGTDPDGADPNLLVVHQGDIQAFVNALWQGGATAVTLMGQRLISTSGVKCVGNTVVLQGVPYSPPYRIEAVGDPRRLGAALAASQAVTYYRQYVARYDLGLEVEESASLQLPAFSGRPALVYADRL
jgi:uncharacterized protein YlxW (UPF0749 family)